MTTNSVIINAKDYQQQYFSDFRTLRGNEFLTLAPVEVEYHSENSSSLSYTELSYPLGMEISSPSTSTCSTASCNPFLTIEEEPKDQLRFRYKSEKGCHGGLKPIVRLNNCESPDGIYIRATLYNCGDRPTLHVFELEGKQCKNGACWQKLSNDFTAKFPALSICMKKKDEISDILKERTKQEYKEQKKRINMQDIEREVQEKMKIFNLNSGRLCFEAFRGKNENDCIRECDPILSKPIYNQKCTLAGELKITRLSSYSGKASGNEDMILLCEKIRKDDIEVIFSYQNENISWEASAQFNPADVHHQVAIPLKTPRFFENEDKEVSIRLRRKSDGKTGEARTFVYKSCDDYDGKSLKRKRPNPSDDVVLSNPSVQCEPCTSTTSDDFDLNPSNMEISESFWKSLLEGWDSSEYSLPFEEVDNVIPNGILNIASLNLSEKPVKKRIIDEWHTNRQEVDEIQLLKTDIINFLKERRSNAFLKFLPALLSVKDDNGNSLLHLVIIEKSENLPLLIKLIKSAPDGVINRTNNAQMTPLHIAISKGLWKVIRILLMSGADPNIRDKHGNTCTHLSVMHGLPRCLAEVLAPLLGDTKTKHFPEINSLNYEGLAPLHLSIQNNYKACVQLLIKAKANINIRDGKCGKTPLHFAYEKSSELVTLLLSQPGVDHNAEDFSGSTPNSCSPKINKNTIVPKPVECCIELSTESSNSNEDEHIVVKEEKCSISEKSDVLNKPYEEKSEDLFCKTLDSNGLWKKLGLYIMNEDDLNVMAVMDTTPTKTILNELKKLHKEKYPEKLKFILSDGELKEFAQLLQ